MAKVILSYSDNEYIFVLTSSQKGYSMKPLGIDNNKLEKAFKQRKPFVNKTGYEVGQIRSGMMVTAIVRYTDKQFKIYAVPATQTVKLDYLKAEQEKRESGCIDRYLTGNHWRNVTLK